MQGTHIQSLAWEDSTCLGVTEPTRHNNWTDALEPGSSNYWNPSALEPVLHTREDCNETPHSQRAAPTLCNQRKAYTAPKTQSSQIHVRQKQHSSSGGSSGRACPLARVVLGSCGPGLESVLVLGVSLPHSDGEQGSGSVSGFPPSAGLSLSYLQCQWLAFCINVTVHTKWIFEAGAAQRHAGESFPFCGAHSESRMRPNEYYYLSGPAVHTPTPITSEIHFSPGKSRGGPALLSCSKWPDRGTGILQRPVIKVLCCSEGHDLEQEVCEFGGPLSPWLFWFMLTESLLGARSKDGGATCSWD